MSLGGLSEHDDKPPIFVISENAFDCLNTCTLLKVDCTKNLAHWLDQKPNLTYACFQLKIANLHLFIEPWCAAPRTLTPALRMCIFIQGDSGGICSTLGNDSMSDSKQKSSHEHGSDFGRLRSYDRFKLRMEGNDYWQQTEQNNKPTSYMMRESRDTHNACNANDKLPSWVRHPPAGCV